jgi:hypothetical protein
MAQFNRPGPFEAAAACEECRPTENLIQKKGSAVGRMPWLWLSTQDPTAKVDSATAWVTTDLPQQAHYIGAIIGKIHGKAGTHTLPSPPRKRSPRIMLEMEARQRRWHIDPSDSLTFTQPYGSLSSKGLAVMELPAEIIWWKADGETYGSNFTSSRLPASTSPLATDWRPLGHPLIEKSPSLGITEAGWTVDCSMEFRRTSPVSCSTRRSAQAGTRSRARHESGLPAINFADAAETHRAISDAAVFPNDRPGKKNEHWPLRARPPHRAHGWHL